MVEGAMGQYRQLRQTPAPSNVGVDTGPPHEGDTGQGVVLHTTLGPIKAILHPSAQGGARAVLWAGGARGGSAATRRGVRPRSPPMPATVSPPRKRRRLNRLAY